MEKSAPLLGNPVFLLRPVPTDQSRKFRRRHVPSPLNWDTRLKFEKAQYRPTFFSVQSPKTMGTHSKYKPIGPDYLRIRKRSVVSYKTRPPSRFSSELSIFQMAVAVGNCYFSVVTSAVKLRSSVSAAQPCFAASLWSTSCCHTFKPVCQSKRAPNSRKGSSSFDQSRSEVKP